MAKDVERRGATRWSRKLALLAVFWGPRGRLVVGPLMALILISAGLRMAWHRWGNAAATGDDFVVSQDAITVTPQPDWIHNDVKAEVVRNSGLDGLSLRDPQLVEQVQRAFALHGWVARVKQVRKRYPARIAVELEYREPVAMVEVHWRGEPSLYFVDKESVLLPKEDHDRSPQQRDREYQEYVRIDAGDLPLAGRISGQPWGGNQIAGAARLAALGRGRWLPMGVRRIVVSEDLNALPIYELETDNSARVLWGHAPGAEVKGEPTAESKWEWLTQFVAKNGSLEKSALDRRLDLQKLSQPAARTAKGKVDDRR